MKLSANSDDLFSLATIAGAPDYGPRLLKVLPEIGDAVNTESAVYLFRHALRLIGADAGVFTSAIRDNAERTSYRSLLACDPLWAIEYARCDWHEHDPWLRHAALSEEPIRSEELTILPDEEPFVRASSKLGFASAVIVPAPSSVGTSRMAVLSLGSHNLGFFVGDSYPLVRILARALAMELNRWLLKAIRTELLARSRVTPREIDLLRHEEAGLTSKMIGAALNIEAKTVDCRFQRLSAKLDAPDRRTAARIARLYGLL